MNLKDLTLLYVKNFNDKNLEKTVQMFSSNSTLKDPDSIFYGTDSISKELSHLYSFDDLKLTPKSISVNEEENLSVLEFHIELGGGEAEGVDVIKWNMSDQIISLTAYVNEVKERRVHGSN